MRLTAWLHAAAVAGLLAFGATAGAGPVYFASVAVAVAALIYEHLEARRGDIASINRAFFLANAVVGIAFVAGTFFDSLASS
jgi:4-hydroxybenzoate polyprenyltransferase